MAHYTINYQCGHQGEVQLVGKTSERERRIKLLEKNECPKCFIATLNECQKSKKQE